MVRFRFNSNFERGLWLRENAGGSEMDTGTMEEGRLGDAEVVLSGPAGVIGMENST